MNTRSKKENSNNCKKKWLIIRLLLFKCFCINIGKEEEGDENYNCTKEDVKLDIYVIPKKSKTEEFPLKETIIEDDDDDFCYIQMDQVPTDGYSIDVNEEKRKVIRDYV
jgi:hypothetical protein